MGEKIQDEKIQEARRCRSGLILDMHCEITRHNGSANCVCWEPIPILAWDADVRVNDFFPVPRACLTQLTGSWLHLRVCSHFTPGEATCKAKRTGVTGLRPEDGGVAAATASSGGTFGVGQRLRPNPIVRWQRQPILDHPEVSVKSQNALRQSFCVLS